MPLRVRQAARRCVWSARTIICGLIAYGLAGYRLHVLLDVFIHHFGNRTFLGLGIDRHGQLAHNFELFRDKWGPERTAHYRLANAGRGPEKPSVPVALGDRPPSSGRMPVSLCMIVRNEAERLARHARARPTTR